MDETQRQKPNPTRKTRGIATAAAVGVAALATAALIPGTFANADSADPSAKGRVEQPEYPIPDLPPLGDNEEYVWDYLLQDGRDSKPASEYGDAFYTWFDKSTDIDLPEKPPVQVFDNEIWVADAANGNPQESTGKSLPVYSLSGVDYGDGWNGPLFFKAPGREVDDVMTLQVWPKASFKQGPGETFEYLANCADREEQTDMKMYFDVTCEESEGPDGATVLTVETVMTKAGTEEIYGKDRTVVMYRADGTAVRTQDSIPSSNHPESGYPLDPKLDPYLSTGDLTELAQAMPDAIVEG